MVSVEHVGSGEHRRTPTLIGALPAVAVHRVLGEAGAQPWVASVQLPGLTLTLHVRDARGVLRLLVFVMLVCGVVSAASATRAQSGAHGAGAFGLGLIIGNPTGVNGKYFLSREIAIDGALGFGVIGDGHVRLHGDVLWHFGVAAWPAAGLDLYLGVGPVLSSRNRRRDNDSLRLGARGPFGAALTFTGAPIDIFLEVAANLWLVDDVRLGLDAAIGARYWF
ncbi:MAG: hypothetical protein OXU20_20275 [Myxococcales bacterium]|nr:hypothetical protein [Myxococcales bacterium]